MKTIMRFDSYRLTMLRMLANLADAEDKVRLAVSRGWKEDAVAYVNNCEDIKDQLAELGCSAE